jgi:uncharacterized membrane protein YbhN (UPF0104 family)
MESRTLPPGDLVTPPARGEQPAPPPGQERKHAWWPWVRRVLSFAFFAAVMWLVARYAMNIDWQEVWGSVVETPAPSLMIAVALAACSHLLYSCFDLFGRRYTGHKLPTRTVMSVTFVSYAFNLCIGSLVGGVAFRYRLYSKLGLQNGVITRVVTMSMLTNWIGYTLLAGLLFLIQPLQLPPNWNMGNHGLQYVGVGLVFTAAAYLFACVRYGDHNWTIHGHDLYLPQWRMAVLQLTISCINWSVMATVVWVLLGQRVAYTDVLTVLLIAAIAGVVAHVPAGLGVFEFVFIALLSHVVPEPRLIAALLVYRAIYYICPLALAAVLYLYMELKAKRQRRAGQRPPAPQDAQPQS